MPQPAPRFSDAQLAAAVDAGESVTEFAVRFGVTPGLVGSRLRRIRIARGEAVQAGGDFSWEDKLRFKPSREAVERLYRTHGGEAVEARWGRQYGNLRRAKGSETSDQAAFVRIARIAINAPPARGPRGGGTPAGT